MTADIEKLKALALAASKGPWCYGENYADNGALAGYNLYAEDGDTLIGEDIGPSEKDIAFMAEANPAAVLELIAAIPEPGSVPVPTTVNMARMMLALGHSYLKENAPEHLTAPDSHVIPPPRGTGSRQKFKEPGFSDSLADRVFNLPCRWKGDPALHAPILMGHTMACEQAYDLVMEHEQASTAGAAKGGSTSDKSIKSGAAGTDKAAELAQILDQPLYSTRQDAARWREVLRHVGGTYTDVGAQRFTLRYLNPVEGADIMKGGVAGHFTAAIDAAKAGSQA